MSKKRLFIINAHPGGNLGAEAMLTVVLKALYSDAGIAARFDFVVEEISKDSPTKDFLETLGIPAAITTFSPRNVVRCYSLGAEPGDVVIDIGGISYQGSSVRSNLRNFIRHRFFLRRNVKMFFFTQDFGPPIGALTRVFASIVMSRAEAIFVRSHHSKLLLESVIGSSSKIIGPYPDVTYRLGGEKLDGLQREKYDLAVVPSAILFNSFGEKYLGVLEFVIRNFQKDGKRVMILTHNFTANGPSSDSKVVALLKDRVSDLDNVCVITHRMSAIAIKALIGHSNFVLTSRYHALVGALSQSVPAVALGWSHKYEEALSIYGLHDASLPADTWLANPEVIIKKIHQLINVETVQKIENKNIENIKLVDESIEKIKTLLREHSVTDD